MMEFRELNGQKTNCVLVRKQFKSKFESDSDAQLLVN